MIVIQHASEDEGKKDELQLGYRLAPCSLAKEAELVIYRAEATIASSLTASVVILPPSAYVGMLGETLGEGLEWNGVLPRGEVVAGVWVWFHILKII